MTGKELLNELLALSDEQLKSEIEVQLCDTKYPTDDGDYDNAYYEYENIVGISFVEYSYDEHWNRVSIPKVRIFGYM